MSDSIFYCVNCTTSQLCHTERKCMRQAHGSPAPICSGGLTNEAFTKFYQHVKDPNNGWIDLGVAKAKSQQEPLTEDDREQP